MNKDEKNKDLQGSKIKDKATSKKKDVLSAKAKVTPEKPIIRRTKTNFAKILVPVDKEIMEVDKKDV